MIEIFPMTPTDIPEAIALWKETEGVSLREGDAPEDLAFYLTRNPGCSFVARDLGRLIGVSLAGYDGRHGYLNHVAVSADYRKRRIGRALVERCLAALKEQGIAKCHLFVFTHNVEGRRFWAHLGCEVRSNLQLMSFTMSDGEDA